MASSIDENAIATTKTIRELGDYLAGWLDKEVRFQRFNIGLIDAAEHMFIDAYVAGQNVTGRLTGHRRTLDGTVVEAAITAGDGIFVGGGEAALLRRFPRFGPVLESGMRAMLAAPLRNQGEVIASLVLASDDTDAFDQFTLDLVNRVGAAAKARIAAFRAVAII
ncbi:MAG: GAF domain-containing protein [Alphaproteobacteria bacterium]|nr:GAF domain-containing protein [Alphaproteobacteria bacterium]